VDGKNAVARRNLVVSHCRRGQGLLQQQQWDKALADYSRAIELDTKYAEAWWQRGKTYAALKQWDKAITDQTQAIQLKSDWPQPHRDLAWLLATCPEARFRNPTRAVNLAERAVQLAPDDGGSYNTLGVAHYRAGDRKAASNALEKSMSLRQGGDPFDWLFFAMAQWRLGKKEEARTWYDRSVAWMEKNKGILDKTPQ
jgi:tetratricopeptide (TPR) repeat protein